MRYPTASELEADEWDAEYRRSQQAAMKKVAAVKTKTAGKSPAPPVARPVERFAVKPNLLYRGENKAMTNDKAVGKAEADPRLVELVVAMVPAAGGEVQPTEEQKKLAEELGKLVEAAQKKAEEKAKAPDEGQLKEAEARFFSGDIAAAAAAKKAEEQAKKDEAQHKAAQAAAGQPVHSR